MKEPKHCEAQPSHLPDRDHRLVTVMQGTKQEAEVCKFCGKTRDQLEGK